MLRFWVMGRCLAVWCITELYADKAARAKCDLVFTGSYWPCRAWHGSKDGVAPAVSPRLSLTGGYIGTPPSPPSHVFDSRAFHTEVGDSRLRGMYTRV
jgi:hypothetical protein